MTATMKKKRRFFDQGVQAISRLKGAQEGCYVCPICEKTFSVSALESCVLTLEHVPQKFRRGRPIILTCKDCNSVAGHKLDSEVFNREELRKFSSALVGGIDQYDGLVKFQGGGETVNAIVTISGGLNRLELPKKHNDPNAAGQLNSYFERLAREGKGDGEEFTITPPMKPNLRLSKVGDLRMAYLAAFALLGYTYVLDSRLILIRRQLREPETEVVQGFWTSVGKGQPKQDGIGLLQEPITALYVQLGYAFVILPWLEGPSNPYSVLMADYKQNQKMSFKGKPLPWPKGSEFLLDFRPSPNSNSG